MGLQLQNGLHEHYPKIPSVPRGPPPDHDQAGRLVWSEGGEVITLHIERSLTMGMLKVAQALGPD